MYTEISSFCTLFVICYVNPGLFWKLMNQLPTTTVDNFYLEMIATFTFSQGMVEWQEIHLENLEMLKTSKMVVLDLKTSTQIYYNCRKMKVK